MMTGKKPFEKPKMHEDYLYKLLCTDETLYFNTMGMSMKLPYEFFTEDFKDLFTKLVEMESINESYDI